MVLTYEEIQELQDHLAGRPVNNFVVTPQEIKEAQMAVYGDQAYLPFSSYVNTVRDMMNRTDATQRKGKDMFCQTCGKSAVKSAIKGARKASLQPGDVAELTRILTDGCNRINYPKRFLVTPSEKRKRRCNKYVGKKTRKLGRKTSVGLGYGYGGDIGDIKLDTGDDLPITQTGDLGTTQAGFGGKTVLYGVLALALLAAGAYALKQRKKQG